MGVKVTVLCCAVLVDHLCKIHHSFKSSKLQILLKGHGKMRNGDTLLPVKVINRITWNNHATTKYLLHQISS